MILLSPPVDYWVRTDKLVCKYIGTNGHPKLKLLVLHLKIKVGFPSLTLKSTLTNYILSWLGFTYAL